MITYFLVVFCCYLHLVMVLSQQQCPDSQSCLFPPSCTRVNFTSGPSLGPPFYDHLLSDVADTKDVDGACTTAFSIGGDSSLLVRVVTFKDGSRSIDKVIYSQVPGYQGAYIGQGLDNSSGCSSLVFNDYFLGVLDPPCNTTNAFYRCFTYGDAVAKYSSQDMVFGYSTDEQISDYCYSQLEAFAASRGLRAHTFVRLPGTKPSQCIFNLTELAAGVASDGNSGDGSGSSCGCDGGDGGNCVCDGGAGGTCGCDGGSGAAVGSEVYGDSSGCWDKKSWWFT